MRLFMGIILGVLLTIGGAYILDSNKTAVAQDVPGSVVTERPMVNWDVVNARWRDLTEGAKQQWHRVTANIDADKAVRTEPRG